MAGPNVITRGQASRLLKPSSEDTVSDNSTATDTSNESRGASRANVANRGRAKRREPSSRRLPSTLLTVGGPLEEDDEKSTPARTPTTTARARGSQRGRPTRGLSADSLESAAQVEDKKPSGPNVTTRSRAKQLKESFCRFPQLPPELRRKVWREAAPDYGIYPVRCNLDLDPDHIPWKVFRLQPLDRGAWDPAFLERVRTTRSLLAACRESRDEVCFLFPDALSCSGGKIRFNGKKDVVMIVPSRQFDGHFMLRLPLSHFSFAGNWNTVVRKLGIFSPMQQILLGDWLFATASLPTGVDPHSRRYLRRLMRVLIQFQGLKQLVLADGSRVSVGDWNKTTSRGRQHLQNQLSDFYWTAMDITRPGILFRPYHITYKRFDSMSAYASNLEQVIRGTPPANLSPVSARQITFGYPQLQGVEIVKLLTLDPELGQLSQEMEFH